MKIIKKISQYLKDNPRSRLSYFVARLYTLFGRNVMNIAKGNHVNKTNTYLKGCKIIIKGRGNDINFGEAANYLTGCLFYISGNNNQITIGERNVLVNGEFWIEDDNGIIELGNRNRILGKTHIAELEGKTIRFGDGCLFSTDVTFRTSDSHAIIDINSDNRINEAKDIIVGNRVWFGNKTTILKGVQIEDDCIIGTGSIVTKSVTSNCIVAGNPAKVVRSGIRWNLQRK